MTRRILLLMLILTVLATVIGSAATIDVAGGTIQAFTFPVSLEVPQEPEDDGSEGDGSGDDCSGDGGSEDDGSGDDCSEDDGSEDDGSEDDGSEDDGIQAGTSIEADVTASSFAEHGEAGSIYGVSGTICVENTSERPTEGLVIVADVEQKENEGKFEDLSSSTVELGDYAVLDTGDEHCYSYEVTFSPIDGGEYRVVARITITNHSGHLGEGFGPEPKADLSLPEA